MRAAPIFPSDKLTVISWPAAATNESGHDSRSRYVETYWLGVLGPSATWLLRKLGDELEASPSGFVMDMAETAQCLGVAGLGKNAPFMRALGRLVQFEMAQMVNDNTLAVRRHIPSLSRRHLLRLPASVQARHEFWMKQQQLTGAS